MLTLLILAAFSTANGAEPSFAGIDNVCAVMDPDPPVYYRIDLVPTGRVPGTGLSVGYGDIMFKPSPFSVTVTPGGNYQYDLAIKLAKVNYKGDGVLVAWLATPDLKQRQRLGTLDENLAIRGSVEWNKFIVVISLEAADDLSDRWRGPIVFRGISRSGLMHTMAGHGPFFREPCATYGY